MALMDILRTALAGQSPEQHFDAVAQTASQEELGVGLA